MRFEELVEIVARLRGPEGCPWDREQTRETLKPYLVEEFYEVIDAMDDDEPEAVKEELGDLLFQIVLQSQLSKEEKKFDEERFSSLLPKSNLLSIETRLTVCSNFS